jgi:hypothetical protein
MKALSLLLVSLLFSNLLRAQEPVLRIAVLAGAGEREYVNQKVRVEPSVEVDDEKGKPVEGATVVFSLPKQGPTGSFESGSKTYTGTTDAKGRVTAPTIRLNRLKGPFIIQVAASFQGQAGNALISETAIKSKRAANFGVSTKTLVYVGIGLLVIAGGIFAYKEFKPGGNSGPLTATPGVPVVGGPQ